MNIKNKTLKIENDFQNLLERYNKSKVLIDQLCSETLTPIPQSHYQSA